jgi:hypothetical protein
MSLENKDVYENNEIKFEDDEDYVLPSYIYDFFNYDFKDFIYDVEKESIKDIKSNSVIFNNELDYLKNEIKEYSFIVIGPPK